MQTDPRIEDYLDHVCAPLVGRVPYATRRELREELAAHIEALVAARREIGSGANMAVREALAQFGDPRSVAREWLREWGRAAGSSAVASARPATLVALGWFGLTTSWSIALLTSTVPATSENVNLSGLLAPFLYVVSPLAAGLATGLLAPARHALGTFYALAILVAVTSLGGELSLRNTRFEEVIYLGLAQGFLWAPLGCAAAALGGWLRGCFQQRPGGWQLPA